MNRRFVAVVAGLGASIAIASAQSFTVATFADPSGSSANPVFTFTPTGGGQPTGNTGVLSGGWTSTGLNLQTPGIPAPDFVNAKFVLTNSQGGGLSITNGVAGAGQIVFTTSANAAIMTVSFQSASYSPFGLGGATLLGNGVTFSGPQVPSGLTNGSFAFSFANQTVGSNLLTMTSSFTSSAAPEPGTIAALGIGAAALIRRRRNRK